MSVSFSCHCPERQKPIKERRWRVIVWKGNNSAFNGYQFRSSNYSEIVCLTCGSVGRTKAKYTDLLPCITGKERQDWLKGLGGSAS